MRTPAKLLCVLSAAAACADGPPAHERHAGAAALSDSLSGELLALAREALATSAQVRVDGDIEAALRRQPRAARYQGAMWQALLLDRHLREGSYAQGVRYTDYDLSVEAREACRVGSTVRMLVRAHLRFGMAPVRPNGETPSHTAGETDHLFFFERAVDPGRANPEWLVSYHHEITLPELHDAEGSRPLLRPCG